MISSETFNDLTCVYKAMNECKRQNLSGEGCFEQPRIIWSFFLEQLLVETTDAPEKDLCDLRAV